MQLRQPTAVDADKFIATLRPTLAEGDLDRTLRTVRQYWSVPQLIALLGHSTADARKMAALSLGLSGDHRAIMPLASALHDPDPMVHQMAEHAMWSIWFRSGRYQSPCVLKEGIRAMEQHDLDTAITKFSEAIAIDPDFAEAYNQRAIAYYLSESYCQSISDCQDTLRRMPQHFGAMAGMGHCYAHQHLWCEARRAYRLALAMNPLMEGVQSSLDQVEQILRQPRCK